MRVASRTGFRRPRHKIAAHSRFRSTERMALKTSNRSFRMTFPPRLTIWNRSKRASTTGSMTTHHTMTSRFHTMSRRASMRAKRIATPIEKNLNSGYCRGWNRTTGCRLRCCDSRPENLPHGSRRLHDLHRHARRVRRHRRHNPGVQSRVFRLWQAEDIFPESYQSSSVEATKSDNETLAAPLGGVKVKVSSDQVGASSHLSIVATYWGSSGSSK